jgi:hypothetical protein
LANTTLLSNFSIHSEIFRVLTNFDRIWITRDACRNISSFDQYRPDLDYAAALPGSLARQSCPAALPGSLARQPCPAALPGSFARQPCSAALPGSSTNFDRI